MTISKPSNFSIFLIIVVLILGWLLFSSRCNPASQSAAVNEKAVDAFTLLKVLNKKRADSIMEFKAREVYSNDVIEEVGISFFQADSTAKAKDQQLKKTQQQLATAKSVRDTAAQLRECDSLTGQLTVWREKFNDAESTATDYVFKTARELYRKDSLIDMQERQIFGLQHQVNIADTLLRHPVMAKLPWLRGYLGATGMVGSYNSIGVSLDLLNRKNFIYKVAIKLGIGGPSYEAGVSKLISFKKH